MTKAGVKQHVQFHAYRWGGARLQAASNSTITFFGAYIPTICEHAALKVLFTGTAEQKQEFKNSCFITKAM